MSTMFTPERVATLRESVEFTVIKVADTDELESLTALYDSAVERAERLYEVGAAARDRDVANGVRAYCPHGAPPDEECLICLVGLPLWSEAVITAKVIWDEWRARSDALAGFIVLLTEISKPMEETTPGDLLLRAAEWAVEPLNRLREA